MSTTLFKNVASQRVRVYAYTPADGNPKTGDSANLTAYIAKDYGAVTALTDTSATEEDATNAPGYYWFDITQTETNADNIMVTAKSATGGVKVLGAPAIIGTRPATGFLAPTVAARTLDVSAGGEAGVDWANVGSPTTALNLSGTSTKALEPTVAGRTLDVAATGEAGLDFSNVKQATSVTVLTKVFPGAVYSFTASAATASTIDDPALGATSDQYNDMRLYILEGTGGGQSRLISDYDSVSNRFTVTPNFTVTPDNTSVVVIFPDARKDIATILGVDVHASAGTVDANVVSLSGDTVAADNAESFFDGTGYAGTNNVIPTVTDVTNLHASAATAANQTTILNRLGAWTGSGLNTILGALRALAAKAAALTPTDISTGTTFDNTTDSAEAIRDRGDAAWGASGVTVPVLDGVVVRSGSTYYVSYHLVVNGAVIAGGSLSALTVTFYDEDGTDLVFSGTPAASSTGIVYASGTLTTGITDNRPTLIKITATYNAVAYSDFLDAVSIA